MRQPFVGTFVKRTHCVAISIHPPNLKAVLSKECGANSERSSENVISHRYLQRYWCDTPRVRAICAGYAMRSSAQFALLKMRSDGLVTWPVGWRRRSQRPPIPLLLLLFVLGRTRLAPRQERLTQTTSARDRAWRYRCMAYNSPEHFMRNCPELRAGTLATFESARAERERASPCTRRGANSAVQAVAAVSGQAEGVPEGTPDWPSPSAETGGSPREEESTSGKMWWG